MRTASLLIAAIWCATCTLAGYIPTDVGGPIGGRADGGGGIRVTAVVAVDGALPIIQVTTDTGFEAGLGVYIPAANEAHGFASARTHNHKIIPGIFVDAGDPLRVIVRGGSGADSLTYRDELVTVLRGGGPGVQVDWELDGPLPPIAHLTVGLGYPVAVTVDLAASGAAGASRYQAYSNDTQLLEHRISLQLPSSVVPTDADVLSAFVLPRWAGVDQPVNAEATRTWTVARGSPPANLAAAASDSLVTVTWDQTAGATEYRVYRRPSGGRWERLPGTTRTGGQTVVTTTVSLGAVQGKDLTLFWSPALGRYHMVGIDATVAWNAHANPDLCGEKELYHISSADLATWTWHDPITIPDLAIEDEGVWRIDGYRIDHLWAPKVLTYDGYYHLFVSGIDRTNAAPGRRIERIMHARMPITSDVRDPANWQDARFALDGSCSETRDFPGLTESTGWNTSENDRAICRDPYVAYSPADSMWVMVATVVTAAGQQAIGVASAVHPDSTWTLHGWYTGTAGTTRESASLVYWREAGIWILGANTGSAGGWWTATDWQNTMTSRTPTVAISAYELLAGPVELPGGGYVDWWPYNTGEAATWLMAAPYMGAYSIRLRSLIARADGAYRLQQRNFIPLEFQSGAEKSALQFVDKTATPGVAYDYTAAAVVGSVATAQADVSGVTPYRNFQNLTLTASGFFAGQFVTTVAPREVAWQHRYRRTSTETETDCSEITEWDEWTEWANVLRPTSTVSVTNYAVDPLEWFHVQVEARTASNPDNVWSRCASHQIPLPPIEPTGLAVDCGGGDCIAGVTVATITWDDNAESHPQFEGYYLERVGMVYGDDREWFVMGSVQETTDTPETADTYFYYIKSLAGGMESSAGATFKEWVAP